MNGRRKPIVSSNWGHLDIRYLSIDDHDRVIVDVDDCVSSDVDLAVVGSLRPRMEVAREWNLALAETASRVLCDLILKQNPCEHETCFWVSETSLLWSDDDARTSPHWECHLSIPLEMTTCDWKRQRSVRSLRLRPL